MTTTTAPSIGTFEHEVESYPSDHRSDLARILIHEDESRTFIHYGDSDDMEFSNPRDNDGNVCNLVVKHSDYVDLDDADPGIEEARDRWGDEHPNVERYVRMFRPDIVHYEPRWEVRGCSQGDWSYGYGYMLRDDVQDAGLLEGVSDPWEQVEIIERAFRDELAIYQRWFEGDVYYAVHISKGAEQFAIGDQGGYLTGEHDYSVDSCGGFLGYDDLKDIGDQFTNSPVIEEVYP